MLLLASRHFFSWLQSSPPFLIISPLYVFTCAGMHHSRRRNNYFCHACSASRVARRLPCKRDFLTDFPALRPRPTSKAKTPHGRAQRKKRVGEKNWISLLFGNPDSHCEKERSGISACYIVYGTPPPPPPPPLAAAGARGAVVVVCLRAGKCCCCELKEG
jgi:hypothetical protein